MCDLMDFKIREQCWRDSRSGQLVGEPSSDRTTSSFAEGGWGKEFIKLRNDLATTEYVDLSLEQRVFIVEILSTFITESGVMRAYLRNSLEQSVKLAARKRKEYSTILKIAADSKKKNYADQKLHRQQMIQNVKENDTQLIAEAKCNNLSQQENSASKDSMIDTTKMCGKAERGSSSCSFGSTSSDYHKSFNVSLSAIQIEAKAELDARYNILQEYVGCLRRTPIGCDRDFREYWLLGGDISRIVVKILPKKCRPPLILNEFVRFHHLFQFFFCTKFYN